MIRTSTPGHGRPQDVSLLLGVLVILEPGEKTRFAQPVTLDELDTWQDLSRSTDQCRGYRCTPRSARSPRGWSDRRPRDPGTGVNRLIIVGTSTVWLTRSRATVSQKLAALNVGIVTWEVPKAGAAKMNGKSAM